MASMSMKSYFLFLYYRSPLVTVSAETTLPGVKQYSSCYVKNQQAEKMTYINVQYSLHKTKTKPKKTTTTTTTLNQRKKVT